MLEKPEGEIRPTFQELLEKHHIPVPQFYARTVVGFAEDFDALINQHIAMKQTLEDMLQTLNELTGEKYTIADIYTRYVYGRDGTIGDKKADPAME